MFHKTEMCAQCFLSRWFTQFNSEETRSIERRAFLKYLPGKDPESSLAPIIVGVCAATVPSFTYRVFFSLGLPLKLKYGKPRLGESTLT